MTYFLHICSHLLKLPKSQFGGEGEFELLRLLYQLSSTNVNKRNNKEVLRLNLIIEGRFKNHYRLIQLKLSTSGSTKIVSVLGLLVIKIDGNFKNLVDPRNGAF